MVKAGWSPSVRLFEAAACGVPIISDFWEGLDSFFEPGREILVARNARQVREILADMPLKESAEIARRARQRVLAGHTAEHRAAELEALVSSRSPARPLPSRRSQKQLASPKLS
jgi:spore maturation protein CgeB